MILALSSMSPTVQAICFGAGVVLLLLDAFGVASRVGLLALGLASFVFVFAWNALAAA